uniref:Uncharacterized protein n=1 Tax=Hordeum vulgare subsp. vulgare TaxID=112509 RepID=A0A8I6Z5E8_HORVV
MSTLPPMIRVQGAQAKKRKTCHSSSALKVAEMYGKSASIPEASEDPAELQGDTFDDIPDIRVEPLSPQKEEIGNVNPPSPAKTLEDLDAIIVTGTGYSKPATAVLTRHTPKDAQTFAEKDITKLKLPHYEKLEFEELYSGFSESLGSKLRDGEKPGQLDASQT